MAEARIYVSEQGAKVLACHEGEDDSTPIGYDGSPLIAYVHADIADAQREALVKAKRVFIGHAGGGRRSSVTIQPDDMWQAQKCCSGSQRNDGPGATQCEALAKGEDDG